MYQSSQKLEQSTSQLTAICIQYIHNLYTIKIDNNTTAGSTWHILHFIRLQSYLNRTIRGQKWYHHMKSWIAHLRQQCATLINIHIIVKSRLLVITRIEPVV